MYMQQKSAKGHAPQTRLKAFFKRPARPQNAGQNPLQNPENPQNVNQPTHAKPENTSVKYSLCSLFLSLGFFVWWLFWAWASLEKSPYLQKLAASLHIFWLGLPLWFWFSCVVSLPLLWIASLFLLPEDAKPAKPSKTRRRVKRSRKKNSEKSPKPQGARSGIERHL